MIDPSFFSQMACNHIFTSISSVGVYSSAIDNAIISRHRNNAKCAIILFSDGSHILAGASFSSYDAPAVLIRTLHGKEFQ